jgi:SSS family solute:Na+ symporter
MNSTAGLQTLDYLAIVGYLVVTWYIAYRATRKTDDTEDFFLGGRNMPWFAVGLSIMATLLSTNTYLGAPGEMIKYGPAYFLGYLAYPFVIAVVMGLWVPFFMRLRLTSAYEFLELRFDRRAKILGSLLFLGLRLGWMSMVVYTASMAMVAMVPEHANALVQLFGASHPIYPVVLAVGVAATIYACVGGIRAVIWTDVLQAVMLFGGVALIIGYVMWTDRSGVGTWWAAVTAEAHSPPKLIWLSWDIAERTTVLWGFFSILAWNCCTHCCDQVALQRYFATTSLGAARRSFLVNILSSSSIGLLLAISGLALRYHYLHHADDLPAGLTPTSGADQLMPVFFAYTLPVGFGGLILVSFLCDALQTLGSGVNSIAAVLTGESSENAPPQGAQGVWRARMTTLAVGAVATTLALGAARFALHSGNTIFDMMPRMFNMFLGPLACLFMIGMFYRRATGGVVFAAILITQAMSSLWSWWAQVPDLLHWLGADGVATWWTSLLGIDAATGKLRSPTVMLAIAAPAAFGLALGALFSALFGRNDHPGVEYTRREVMKRPVPEATA